MGEISDELQEMLDKCAPVDECIFSLEIKAALHKWDKARKKQNKKNATLMKRVRYVMKNNAIFIGRKLLEKAIDNLDLKESDPKQ